MTIGDVLAVVAVVIGLGLSGWALLVGLALLFTGFAAKAQAHLENAPGATFGIGLGVVVTVGLGSVALLNVPNGLLKLIGWLLLVILLLLSALGAGGLALLLNRRIRGLEPELSEFKALCRGASILALAGLMPLFGWAIVTPLVLITSLGASIRTLWHGRRAVAPAPIMSAAGTNLSPLMAPVVEAAAAPMMTPPSATENLSYPFAATLPAAPLTAPRRPALSDEPVATAATPTTGP